MTKPIPILDDDAVAEIRAKSAKYKQLANRAATPADADVIRWFAKNVNALCQTVRALRAKHEWLRSKIAWHRDGVGPDVPVLQERYDKLIAQRNDLRSQLEQVTKERDGMREKVKSMRADYRKRAEEADREHDNVAQLILLHKATAASEIITALESVSIQEQEKQ